MRSIWRMLIAVVIAIAVAVAVVAGLLAFRALQANARQSALDAFYTPPSVLPTQLGAVIRLEPLDQQVAHGRAMRMLYVSERPDGERAASGAMLFIPDDAAPPTGRPVVAWAHGTLGQGDACAPSRSADPIKALETWLPGMLDRGWVVVATDYTGMGTPGPNLYLVGGAEARDVVNAVRAARNVPEADAGSRYVAWGHSQGGHSALWTGELSRRLAPELDLVGVAAAAPAAELPLIMGVQWSTDVGWAIGPEVADSWPLVYPDLPVDVISPAGQRNERRLAQECIGPAALEGYARTQFGQDFFASDPSANAAWRTAARDQVPAPLPGDLPVLLAQSTADQVVLAWPNAVLQERWCSAGSDIASLWVGRVSHMDTALVVGPQVVMWIAERFAGIPSARTCAVAPPASIPAGTAAN